MKNDWTEVAETFLDDLHRLGLAGLRWIRSFRLAVPNPPTLIDRKESAVANKYIYSVANAAPNAAGDWTKRELITVENGVELPPVEIPIATAEGEPVETPEVNEGATCSVKYRDYDNVGKFTDSAETPFTVDDTDAPDVPNAPTILSRREV